MQKGRDGPMFRTGQHKKSKNVLSRCSKGVTLGCVPINEFTLSLICDALSPIQKAAMVRFDLTDFEWSII